MISVLILTLNEELNLQRCLDSVSWSDDIVVLDSGSTDGTPEIAKRAGARFITRAFDDERSHRTYSLHQIRFKYPWIYNPDADEETPQCLRDEMLRTVSDGARPEVAYRMRFKTMFLGRWLRYSSLYPTWVVRLFRPERISFERSINLRYVIDGPSAQLESHFIHHTFNNGFHAWFEKHNRYSTVEAQEAMRILRSTHMPWRDFISHNAVDRRAALKDLSFRLPLRPVLRFLYMYVVRRGFLDGRPGLTYCTLLAMYEYMIVLKQIEMSRRAKGLTL
jgi:glycosyltransferase involved in cell wall biosynthesis